MNVNEMFAIYQDVCNSGGDSLEFCKRVEIDYDTEFNPIYEAMRFFCKKNGITMPQIRQKIYRDPQMYDFDILYPIYMGCYENGESPEDFNNKIFPYTEGIHNRIVAIRSFLRRETKKRNLPHPILQNRINPIKWLERWNETIAEGGSLKDFASKVGAANIDRVRKNVSHFRKRGFAFPKMR